MIEEANDYYFPTLTGLYLKFSRTLITIMTVFLTPVFCFYAEPQLAPKAFEFVAVKDMVNIPLIFQLADLGNRHRWAAAGSALIPQHAEYAAERNRRSGYGRILITVRLV